MANKINTVEFLAVWEELHNPDFNRVQFEAVRSEAGLNRFVMTPTKWIEQTNAIGIVSKAGRYGGGTYAHSDIAMAFATWISPKFQLYIMKDYRRLKQDENSRFSLDWNKSIKKRKDGSSYKDFYYYGCKHRNMTRGHKCDYKKQVHEEMLDH